MHRLLVERFRAWTYRHLLKSLTIRDCEHASNLLSLLTTKIKYHGTQPTHFQFSADHIDSSVMEDFLRLFKGLQQLYIAINVSRCDLNLGSIDQHKHTFQQLAVSLGRTDFTTGTKLFSDAYFLKPGDECCSLRQTRVPLPSIILPASHKQWQAYFRVLTAMVSLGPLDIIRILTCPIPKEPRSEI